MSSEPLALDPILEELLHEVARDPRSSLLRVERPARPTRWTDSWDALSRWHPGLTSAEKEILDVHRAEFATLLLRRWALEVELRPPPKLFLVSSATPRNPSNSMDPREFSEALLGWQERALPHPAELAPQELLDPASTIDGEKLSALVVTAVRMHPSSSARIYHAMDLIRAGQPRTAGGMMRRLLASESREDLRSYCWETLALAHGDDWNPSDLIDWYGRAMRAPTLRFEPIAVSLLMAVQHGEPDLAREASGMLDGSFAADAQCVARHVVQQLRTRAEGRWSPTPGAGRLSAHLLEEVGPTSRRILHVLQ